MMLMESSDNERTTLLTILRDHPLILLPETIMLMKYLFIPLIPFVFLLACKEKETDVVTKREISLGVRDSIFSNILNEPREIWVHVPESFHKNATKKYPVVYLLDGDAHFYSVAGMIHQLSTVNGNTICPEMIVVGIPNTDRTRDLTPSHVAHMFGDTTFSRTSGGADKFTQFIREELIPFIDNHYPTTSYRTLIGHSFGGLFAINALVNHSDLFNNYLAIDPSLWWDDQKLSKQATEILKQPGYTNKSLYVAVANTMEKGMDVSNVHTDTTESTEHIRSILSFNQQTELAVKNGLNFKWKYYGEDSHGSVPLIAEYDALRFLFSWYKFEGVDEFFFPDSKLTAQEVMDQVLTHFKNISSHFGYTVPPDETLVNAFGYEFLQSKKPEHSYLFFKLNTENCPQSANVYDSMGDYYLAQQDTARAIENFAKAVSLGNLPYSREKLDKLSVTK